MSAQTVTFAARDGYPLRGELVAPEAPRAGLLVTGGTGFPARYYRRFAGLAAARGYVALTFDPRGIGASAPDDLGGFDMHYAQWGTLDAPAALDRLAAAVHGLPLVHVAHSVGGHFLGLWDNAERVAAHAFACVGSGYWRDHPPLDQARELYFWHAYGPRSLRKHGYVARGGGWTGASLPRGVFEPWKRWCRNPRYFLDEIGEGALAAARFGAVHAPVRSWIYADDGVANAKTGPVMLGLYENADRSLVLRAPAEHGLPAIGHAGPFGRGKERAAAELLDWLDGQL